MKLLEEGMSEGVRLAALGPGADVQIAQSGSKIEQAFSVVRPRPILHRHFVRLGPIAKRVAVVEPNRVRRSPEGSAFQQQH